MERPKWFVGDRNLEIGDVVLLKKQEGGLAGQYRYGLVEETYEDVDGIMRRVRVRYRNHNEEVDRFTNRSVGSLVLIKRVDEMDLWEIMYDASAIADMNMVLDNMK